MTICNEILKIENLGSNYENCNEPGFLKYVHEKEICSNALIKTSTKVKYNRSDMILWDKTNRVCKIKEFSSPADVNITKISADFSPKNYGSSIKTIDLKLFQLLSGY